MLVVVDNTLENNYIIMKNKKILISITIVIVAFILYIGYNNCENVCYGKTGEITNEKIDNLDAIQTISTLWVIEFKKELEMWDKILIDIRTKEEIDTLGLIWKNALNLDIYKSDFSSKLDTLDKSKKYLIYCRSGNRTKSALNIMKEKWFIYVKDLNGGITSWINNWEKVFK